jgi:AcrR family transcriptional regulator
MRESTDITTEERIKEAARIVFTQKGFLATTIRDIATQADINLASVNYYFRTKEKLFEIIMAETVQKLFDRIEPVINDETTTLVEKITLIVNHYIDYVLEHPNMPYFVLSEVMSGSDPLPFIKNKKNFLDSAFSKQLIELQKEGNVDFHPVQIILNLTGMIIFPFITRPLILKIGDFDTKEFVEIVNERRKLIPIWMKQMLNI